MQFLFWIISGLISGWLTGLLFIGSGFGLIDNLVLRLPVGWQFGLLGLQTFSWLGNLFVICLSGIVLIIIIRIFQRA